MEIWKQGDIHSISSCHIDCNNQLKMESEDAESKFNPDEIDMKENGSMLNVPFLKSEQQGALHEEIEKLEKYNYNCSSQECVNIKEEYDHNLQDAQLKTEVEDAESKSNPEEIDIKENISLLMVPFLKNERQDVMKEEIEVEKYNYTCSSQEYVDFQEDDDHNLQDTQVLVAARNDQALHTAKEIRHVQNNSKQIQHLKHRENTKGLQKVTVSGRYKLLHPDHFRYSCEECGKCYSKQYQLNNHKRVHTGELLLCNVCGKSFVHKGSLYTHMLQHTGQDFPCEICGKLFPRRGYLTTHMSVHTDERFPCKICGRSLKKSTFNKHMSLHTGNQFSCELCGKSFRQRRYLHVHMAIHTGKRFSCDICGKFFAQKRSLNLHLHLHSETNEKTCVNKGKLNAHMRRHTGKKFSCKICGMLFTRRGNLTAHMSVHNGEHMACKVCGRYYSRKGTLNRHMSFHTGVRFSCDV